MSLFQELLTTTALVKSILENDEQARNNDSHLYMRVLEVVSVDWDTPIKRMTVCDFLKSRKDLGAPSFETVRRTRQKIQATYPELAASNRVRGKRLENEEEYRAFAHEII